MPNRTRRNTLQGLLDLIDAARVNSIAVDTVMMRPTDAERFETEARQLHFFLPTEPQPLRSLLGERGFTLKLSTKVAAGEVLIYDEARDAEQAHE